MTDRSFETFGHLWRNTLVDCATGEPTPSRGVGAYLAEPRTVEMTGDPANCWLFDNTVRNMSHRLAMWEWRWHTDSCIGGSAFFSPLGDKKEFAPKTHHYGYHIASQWRDAARQLIHDPYSRRSIIQIGADLLDYESVSPLNHISFIPSAAYRSEKNHERPVDILLNYRTMDMWNTFPYDIGILTELCCSIVRAAGRKEGKVILQLEMPYVLQTDIGAVNKLCGDLTPRFISSGADVRSPVSYPWVKLPESDAQAREWLFETVEPANE